MREKSWFREYGLILAAGVAVGLALKDSLSSFAAGILILFNRHLHGGDTRSAVALRGRNAERDRTGNEYGSSYYNQQHKEPSAEQKTPDPRYGRIK